MVKKGFILLVLVFLVVGMGVVSGVDLGVQVAKVEYTAQPLPANAIDPAAFTYVGAFALPSENNWWARGDMVYAADRDSLYLFGMVYQGNVGEISIPEPVPRGQPLPVATVKQSFRDVSNGWSKQMTSGSVWSGCLTILDGQLVYSQFIYYNVAGILVPSYGLATMGLQHLAGAYQIGDFYDMMTSGYCATIPEAFQQAFGGKILAGQSSLGQRAGTSDGPAAIAFTPPTPPYPAHGTKLPAKLWLRYYPTFRGWPDVPPPEPDTQQATYKGPKVVSLGSKSYRVDWRETVTHAWKGGSNIFGGMEFPVIDGKTAVIYAFQAGMGPDEYVQGTYTWEEVLPDGTVTGKGTVTTTGVVSAPYQPMLWFYSTAELLRTDIEPWQKKPYAVMNMGDDWFVKGPGKNAPGVGGVAYDSKRKRLYVVQEVVPSSIDPNGRSVVHVYRKGAQESCTEEATRSCYTGTAETQNMGPCKAGNQTCQDGFWGSCIGEVLPTQEIIDGKDNNCNNLIDDGLGCNIGNGLTCEQRENPSEGIYCTETLAGCADCSTLTSCSDYDNQVACETNKCASIIGVCAFNVNGDGKCDQAPECTDKDNDGYGVGQYTNLCQNSQLDCNDNDPNINPGAYERPNDNIDNNCNGIIDTDAPSFNTESLMFYSPLDEAQPKDLSGNNIVITPQNGAAFIQNGKFNGAFDLSTGGNDKIFIADSVATQLTSSFTFAVWMYPKTLGNWGPLLYQGQGCCGTQALFQKPGSSSTALSFHVGGQIMSTSSNVIVPNKWQFVAAVFDEENNKRKIYVDGNLVAEDTFTGSPQKINVGMASGDTNDDNRDNYDGLIDELSIWHRALSTEEIQALSITSLKDLMTNSPICGNSLLEFNEQCDDGNLVNGDGCDASCKIEQVKKLGDVNGDGFVNIVDLVLVASNFGKSVPPGDVKADLNNDGVVNISDLVIVAVNFGS
jgi:cysteine-rich repeat protein